MGLSGSNYRIYININCPIMGLFGNKMMGLTALTAQLWVNLVATFMGLFGSNYIIYSIDAMPFTCTNWRTIMGLIGVYGATCLITSDY